MTAETRWENGAAETQGRRVQPCIQSESLLEEEEEEEEECCKGKGHGVRSRASHSKGQSLMPHPFAQVSRRQESYPILSRNQQNSRVSFSSEHKGID